MFHFTASNITAAQNRHSLLDEAGRWAGETLRAEDHPTWRTALRALLELHPDERAVFVLDEVQYLERIRSFGVARNRPYSYRLSDFAFRFHYGLVVPNESAIETAGAESVWTERLAKNVWPAYMGQHVFEDVVRQAYLQLQDVRDVPVVSEWGYWQGRSPNDEPVEIDAVCRLLDGRMMTGSVRYRSRPASASVWTDHVRKLTQLRGSGRKWVREALKPDAPFLFVSRSGFTDSFHAIRRDRPERPVIMWTLEDLFE